MLSTFHKKCKAILLRWVFYSSGHKVDFVLRKSCIAVFFVWGVEEV